MNESKMKLKGVYHVQAYDQGRLLWEDKVENLVTNVGLNHVLDTVFHGSTPASPWYIGLIKSTSYTGVAAGDTLSSHGGWLESTDYSGDRKEWTEGAASSQSMTNAATVDFAMSGSVTIKGVFLCSAATGTSGTLMSAGLFTGGDHAVTSTTTLKITYTITAADA